ncbi:MAG: hypothetical protein NTW78_05875 [Campylobacterales bacterium]|nr:hypothetical protein [Campylobacterales bacterium]
MSKGELTQKLLDLIWAMSETDTCEKSGDEWIYVTLDDGSEFTININKEK